MVNLLAYIALCGVIVATFGAAWSVLEWFATGRPPRSGTARSFVTCCSTVSTATETHPKRRPRCSGRIHSGIRGRADWTGSPWR